MASPGGKRMDGWMDLRQNARGIALLFSFSFFFSFRFPRILKGKEKVKVCKCLLLDVM